MTITVNGRRLEYARPTISFETASLLALVDAPTIRFRTASGCEGELGLGDVLGVSEGLVITISGRER